MAGVKSLAFSLATGVLLVILSCALFQNWWPLFVVFTYILAPFPNMIFGRCAGSDDLFSDNNSGLKDIGYFITSFFIVTGFGLPMVLAHAHVIAPEAATMSIIGGMLVYITVIVYTKVFSGESESYW
ncbi:vacuolar protein sorting 55 [Paraphysoderma sedebokerense]|nr:vacuolar protein sorting 55 [Paraphysoderma sedebokerense]